MDVTRRLRPGTRPVVLDGGLGTDLEAHGAVLPDALWSARLLRDDPASVRAAHARFAHAGADVLTTASYQAGLPGFAAVGVGAAAARELIASSVALARQGAADAGRPDLVVAGSIGPRVAADPDRSEYRDGDVASVAELRAYHRPRLAALVEAGADVLALETLSSRSEVGVLLDLLTDHPGVRAWVSLTTVDGDTTPSGASLEDVLALAAGHPQVIAAGVNCCPPAVVPRAVAHGATIAYPNLGDRWDANDGRWVRDGAATRGHLDAARDWVAGGVWLVGGCCGTTPDDITGLRARLTGGTV